ncbi:hypothetical protein [Legionella impletisoli]|uniref:Uncharacterized protein n=1 Tax=Legionella impletisoli TaxID=343510 RepID=A0A917JVQ7_9GAMM|nr:hypothetical protein [Legionella impletisoli]GGI88368.1 hypothetical protein GCM10007966_16440 [Legionella impletisoli]
MVKLTPEPDTELTPEEKLLEDLKQEGSSNDLLHNSFISSDEVDSLEDGVPGYETTGEEVLVGEGIPGFETTGEVRPMDETENQLEEEHFEEESSEEESNIPRP